ncbi:MAG: RNA ligase family protein [Candidatus Methanoperedens sp.]|nr:RNA ligase family protein [Candidatus Methanoperedens sp.]
MTEKIDGMNGQILIAENNEPIVLTSGRTVPFLCGSRSRWIFPENDNHGFARWAYENTKELLKLGPGRHFGEWWGSGIQRNYGLKEKRFSLFNVKKWSDPLVRPSCCYVVPVIADGPFGTEIVKYALEVLAKNGSYAAPGFMKPEGIIIFHIAGNFLFKKTLEGDEVPKGKEE